MAHGLNAMLKRGTNTLGCKSDGKTGIGSRRIFAPQFKLQVLDSYRNDADCKGNQRATARKYGIHRRQIQKWLQVENNLRNSVIKNKSNELIVSPEARKCGIELALRSADHRQRDDVCSEVVYSRRQRQVETEAELEHSTALRIGGPEVRDVTAVDKRVPDIPQQHSPSLQLQQQTVPSAVSVSVSIPLPSSYTTTLHHHHEWQSSRSPDTCSSSDFSHASPQPPPLAYPTSPAATPFKCECPEASSSLPLPLDFTTHSRRTTLDDSPRGAITPTTVPQIPSPIVYTTLNSSESAAPMDLSLKKPYMPLLYPRIIHTDLHAPVPLILCPNNTTPPLHNSYTTATLSPVLISDPQIWDLSTKGIKRQHDEISPCVSSSEDTTTNRPVKLFKPYLDIIEDDEYRSQHEPDVKPIIVSSVDHYSDNEQHFIYNNNNNNNNNNDFKMDYTFYKDENHMDARNFYYHPMGSDYYPNGGLHFISAAHYDEHRNSFVFNKTNHQHHPNAIKQRQSYSLDFKLNAIECYYSDAVCRGNQRAVASKFKIHRRQVQKWLKQEQQLRQRNETTKPMHIVR